MRQGDYRNKTIRRAGMKPLRSSSTWQDVQGGALVGRRRAGMEISCVSLTSTRHPERSRGETELPRCSTVANFFAA